jgi:DNA adenine methylase
METLKFQITSRGEFERLARCDPATLTDLERAARFLYLQRLAFGSKVIGRSFGVDTTGGARFNLNHLGSVLEDVHERLSGVVIECLDWSTFVDRYDRPGILFYLDPPYYGNESDYGADAFHQNDFARIAERLKTLSGRFILSINDCPAVREIFSDFNLVEVPVKYTIAAGAPKDVAELIILDRKLPAILNMPRS